MVLKIVQLLHASNKFYHFKNHKHAAARSKLKLQFVCAFMRQWQYPLKK